MNKMNIILVSLIIRSIIDNTINISIHPPEGEETNIIVNEYNPAAPPN